jgi:hypothetical protein
MIYAIFIWQYAVVMLHYLRSGSSYDKMFLVKGFFLWCIWSVYLIKSCVSCLGDHSNEF